MHVKGEKRDERLEQLKATVNGAVETFVEASKKAEDKMSFKAFTLGEVSLKEQYSLSDIILTQAAIHLKEYTHDSIDKYTYSCATSLEGEDDKNLVIWFNFSKEKPGPPEVVELTDEDIKPSFLVEDEDDKSSTDVVTDTLVGVSGMGHVEAEEHVIRGATYDA
jgi:hypothetical protein